MLENGGSLREQPGLRKMTISTLTLTHMHLIISTVKVSVSIFYRAKVSFRCVGGVWAKIWSFYFFAGPAVFTRTENGIYIEHGSI